jgi:hypothetical protein
MAGQLIPEPQALDPNRLLRQRGTQFTEDDRPETELLHAALAESCAYAQQLWHVLDDVRGYLLASLPPPDPHTSSVDHPARQVTGASPTGPDDEDGWQNWTTTFATVTSVLCGPHGDSGFGVIRAHQEANQHRDRPPDQDEIREPDPRREANEDQPKATEENAKTPSAAAHDRPPAEHDSSPHRPTRFAVLATLVLLALRGLRRPRQRLRQVGDASVAARAAGRG